MLDDQGDPPRLLRMLFEPALQELQAKHPNLNIKLDYRPIPYLDLRPSFLQAMANKTSVDIMTVDYIWLGEFVKKAFLQILPITLRIGEEPQTGMKRIGMVVLITIQYIGYGLSLMPEEYGIGRISCSKQE